MTTYRVIGTTEEVNHCECCGRQDLKRTVALLDNETGDITYFGTTCAANAAGWTVNETTARIRAAEAEARAAEQARQAEAREEAGRAYHAWIAQEAGVTAEQVRADYRGIATARFGSCLKALSAYRAAQGAAA